MLQSNQNIIRHKVGLLNLAEELGNVSKACQMMGLSRDTLNDKVLPFYEEHGLPVLRILTDRGTEYCGRADRHNYQLFLVINDIEHTKTKVKSPQINGICERFHKMVLQEFYQVAFRKKIYDSIEMLQNDLDEWINHYNNERTH